MVQAQIEVPETWDTIKYEKPLYPTCSRGMFGKPLYVNNKYHCYSVYHSKPTYDLTPYRATGFGYAARAMKYIPLTHVQDRSNPKPQKVINKKSEIKKIYEASIDSIKLNAELRNENILREARDQAVARSDERNYDTLVRKMQYDIHSLTNKTEEMIGGARFRTHQINRLIDSHCF